MKNYGKYVIPIISLSLAIVNAVFSVLGFAITIAGTYSQGVMFLGSVLDIISLCTSCVLLIFVLIFTAKSKLCRAAAIIDGVSAVFAVIGLILWQNFYV